jgi:hypothetical protein
MRSIHSNRSRPRVRFGVFFALAIALVALGDACKLGGKEGDQCNALILHADGEENCNAGFVCKPFSCSASYCCPKNGTSSDPNCNGEGCPDEDAGEDGGNDGSAEAAPDTETDGGANALPDSSVADGGDSG